MSLPAQRLIEELSAVFASIYVLNILNDFRLNQRYIDNLMTQRFFVGFFKICATTRTYLRVKFDTLGNFFRRQQLSQMRLMAFLCSTFFTSLLWQYSRHSWRIRRRWFGRILRIHPQKPFQLLDPLFQLRVFSFQFSDLLFIELFSFRCQFFALKSYLLWILSGERGPPLEKK